MLDGDQEGAKQMKAATKFALSYFRNVSNFIIQECRTWSTVNPCANKEMENRDICSSLTASDW